MQWPARQRSRSRPRTTASIPCAAHLGGCAEWAPFCFSFFDWSDGMDNKQTRAISRRSVLQGAAALGAAGAIGALTPLRARAQTALETKAAKLGFIALTDAAPLFVADEKGFFKKHGMTEVEVLKQSSWGATRDNIVLGLKAGGIDGAHILTPMTYLITTGAVTANNVQVPMNIVARLNLGGQVISVAKAY